MQHPVPIDILRQILRLDAGAGELYWLPRGPEWFAGAKNPQRMSACFNAQFSDKRAFTTTEKDGHKRGRIFGRAYLAARVVFALFHGRWPEGDVDHRDRDPGNDYPGNLRDASHRDNMLNRRGLLGASSGYKGVSWFPQTSKWHARCVDASGKTAHLGYFATEEDAARVVDAFAVREHGEFAYLNFPDREAEGRA